MASDVEVSCMGDPNFAVICSFLERFSKPCGITHPNTLELQEMLENSLEVPQPLVDLHVKLLRKAKKSVSTERWERALIKFCHSYSNQDGWEIERFGYKKARLAVKLRVLKTLLELQFDLNSKFKAEINRLSAEELRCRPLGRDKLGQTYWCQQDEDCNLRIYREDLDDETWEVVAKDREGLVQLISQLSSNDPFRKDPEAALNDDSNSLGIEKPITDTGQTGEVPDAVRTGRAETDLVGQEDLSVDCVNGVSDVHKNSIIEVKTGDEHIVNKISTSTDVKVSSVHLPCGLTNIRQPSIVLKRCESTSFKLDSSNVLKSNSSNLDTHKTSVPSCEKTVQEVEEEKAVKDAEKFVAEGSSAGNEQVVKEVQAQLEKTEGVKDSNDRDGKVENIEEIDNCIGKANEAKVINDPDIKQANALSPGKTDDLLRSGNEDKPEKEISLDNKLSSKALCIEKDTDATNSVNDNEKDTSANNLSVKPKASVNCSVDLSKSPSSSNLCKPNSKLNASDVKLKETIPEFAIDLIKKDSNDLIPSKGPIDSSLFDSCRKEPTSLKIDSLSCVDENVACDLSKKPVVEERSSCKIKIVVPEKYREQKLEPIQNSATDLTRKKLLPEKITDIPVGSLPSKSFQASSEFNPASSLKLQKEQLTKKRVQESSISVETKRLCVEGSGCTIERSSMKTSDFDEDFEDYDEDDEDVDDEDDDIDGSMDSEVGEAIEEPLMLIRGEGSGKDCDTGNPGKEEHESSEERKEKKSPAGDSGCRDALVEEGKELKISDVHEDKDDKDSRGVGEHRGLIQGNKVLENGTELGTNPDMVPEVKAGEVVSNKEIVQGLAISKTRTDCSSEEPIELTDKLSSGNAIHVTEKSEVITETQSIDGGTKIDLFLHGAPLTSPSNICHQLGRGVPEAGESGSGDALANFSPVKSSPKLWSIETICAPDDKVRDQPKSLIDVNIVNKQIPPLSSSDTASMTEDEVNKTSFGVQMIKKSPTSTSTTADHMSQWDVNKSVDVDSPKAIDKQSVDKGDCVLSSESNCSSSPSGSKPPLSVPILQEESLNDRREQNICERSVEGYEENKDKPITGSDFAAKTDKRDQGPLLNITANIICKSAAYKDTLLDQNIESNGGKITSSFSDSPNAVGTSQKDSTKREDGIEKSISKTFISKENVGKSEPFLEMSNSKVGSELLSTPKLPLGSNLEGNTEKEKGKSEQRSLKSKSLIEDCLGDQHRMEECNVKTEKCHEVSHLKYSGLEKGDSSVNVVKGSEMDRPPVQGFFFGPGCLQHSIKSEIKSMAAKNDSEPILEREVPEGTSKLGDSTVTKKTDFCASNLVSSSSHCSDKTKSLVESFSLKSAALCSNSDSSGLVPDNGLLDLTKATSKSTEQPLKSQNNEWISQGSNKRDSNKFIRNSADERSFENANISKTFTKDFGKSVSSDCTEHKKTNFDGSGLNLDKDALKGLEDTDKDHSSMNSTGSIRISEKKLGIACDIEGIKAPTAPRIHRIEQIMTSGSVSKGIGEPVVSESQKMLPAVSSGIKSPILPKCFPGDLCMNSNVMQAPHKHPSASHGDKFIDKSSVIPYPGAAVGELSSGFKTLPSCSHVKSKLDLLTKPSQQLLSSTSKNRRKSVESITMGIMMGKLAAKGSLQDSTLSQIKSLDEVMGANRPQSSDNHSSSFKTDSVKAPSFNVPVILNPPSFKGPSEKPENLSSKILDRSRDSCVLKPSESASSFNKPLNESCDATGELLPRSKQRLESGNIINLSSKAAVDLSITKASSEGSSNSDGLQGGLTTWTSKDEDKKDDKRHNQSKEIVPLKVKPVAENSVEERNKVSQEATDMKENNSNISTRKLENISPGSRVNEHNKVSVVDEALHEEEKKRAAKLPSILTSSTKEVPNDKVNFEPEKKGNLSQTVETRTVQDEQESVDVPLNSAHNEITETSKSSALSVESKSSQNMDLPSSPTVVEVKPPGTISVVPFERLSAGRFPDISAFQEKCVKEDSSKSSIVDEAKVNPPRGLKVVPFEKLSDKASVATILENSKDKPVTPLIKVVPFEKLIDCKPLSKETKPSGIKVVPFEKLSDKKLTCSNNSPGQSLVLREDIVDMKATINKLDSSSQAFVHPRKDSESVMISRVQKQLAKKLQGPDMNILQTEKRSTRGKAKNQIQNKAVEHNDKGAQNVIADRSVLECLKNKDVEILPVIQASTGNVRPHRGRLQVKAFAKQILSVDEGKSGQTSKKVASFSDNSSDVNAKVLHMKDVEILKSSAISFEPIHDVETPKVDKKKPFLSVISIDKLKEPETVALKNENSSNNSVSKAGKSKKMSPVDKVNNPDQVVVKADVCTNNTTTKGNRRKKGFPGKDNIMPIEDIPKNDVDDSRNKLSKNDTASLPDVLKTETSSDIKKANKVKKVDDCDTKPVQRETRTTRSRSSGAPLIVQSLPRPRGRKSKVQTPEKPLPEVNQEVKSPAHITSLEKDTVESIGQSSVVPSVDKPVEEKNGVGVQSEVHGAVGIEKECGSKKEKIQRKRNHMDTESEVGSEDAGGKRRKVRGKRVPDLKLRHNVELQKQCEAGDSSSDDIRPDPNEGGAVSSDESHSLPLAERTAISGEGKKPAKGRRKKGRGRRKGFKVAVDSPAPSSDAPSEQTENKSHHKSKGRQKRAPKLLGLNVGVDIILEQSNKSDAGSNASGPPVRQSRRIAQIKIREDAERRKLEELTLFQLKEDQRRRKHTSKHHVKDSGSDKKKRRKKMAESDEDYTAEDRSEDKKKPSDKKRKKKKKVTAPSFNENNPWQSSSGSSSSQEEEEDDLDHTEYEEEEEVVLEFKSDHEFSPESDLEEEPAESLPTRRARTAQKDEDTEEPPDKYACQKCGKSDHPEWILLCDKCDSGWHGSCLRPALLVIPEGDWFCPPCEHTTLLENLEENLKIFDRNAKRRDNEELRRKRLAYVGISLDNVLPNKEKEEGYGESKHGKRSVRSSSSSSSSSASSSSSSDSSSGDESEPVYQLRQRRQALFSYRFNEYDDLINSAIQDEMEAVKGAGNQGRGKDIATIVNAEKEEKEESKDVGKEDVINGDAGPEDKKTDREGEEKQTENEEEQEEEEEEEEEGGKGYIPPIRKFPVIRKKHRRLNNLDITSEDDADSDEDFKGSSSEEDEDDDEDGEGEDTDDSDLIGRRRRGGSRLCKNSGPLRRSGRARTTRFDKEFINDDSEDSEPRKKTRRLWQESESEESDGTWGARKKRKQFVSHKPKSKRKKNKYSYESDYDTAKKKKKKKKPKIKYGGLDDDDDDSPVRRTRGRKINYQEMAGSETEEEVLNSTRRKLESEDEYIAQEDDDDDDEEPAIKETDSDSDDRDESRDNKRDSNSDDDGIIAVKKKPVKPEHPGKKAGIPKLKKNVIRDDSGDESEDEMKQIEEEMKRYSEADKLAEQLNESKEKKEVPPPQDDVKNKKEIEKEDNCVFQTRKEEHSLPDISDIILKTKQQETKREFKKELVIKLERHDKKTLQLKEKHHDEVVVDDDDDEEEEEGGEDDDDDDDDESDEEGEEEDDDDDDEEEEVEVKGKKTKDTLPLKPVVKEFPPAIKEKEPEKVGKSLEKEEIEPGKKPKGRIEVVPMEILCGKPMQKDMQPVQLLKNFPPLQHQKDTVSQALKDLVVTQTLKGSLDHVSGPMINEPSTVQVMENMAPMQVGALGGGLLKPGLDVPTSHMTGTQALKDMMNMHALKGNLDPEIGKNIPLAHATKMPDGEFGVGGLPMRMGQSGMVLDHMPPAGVTTPTKRRGRGRGKATLAAQAAAAAAAAASVSSSSTTTAGSSSISSSVLDSGLVPKGSDIGQVGAGSRYPPPQHFQHHSNSSVITRMLQSQPMSPGSQSFTAAAAAMGHKYFGSSASDSPSLVGPPSAGRGTTSLPPYSIPPKGRIPSPYRQPPPLTESPNNSPSIGMGHFVNSPASRGSSVRAPLGNLQQMSIRMRNPGANNQPIYHTSHHPMDPSPSGGGPIVIASSPGQAGESSSPLHQQSTTSPSSSSPLASKSNSSHSTPPPPPYTRPPPPLSMGQGPSSNNSITPVPFPIPPPDASSSQNGPPVRHPPPPFPPNTSVNHLQHPSPPPPHQGRSPVPGNYSPFHAPPTSNYHYGTYPPPSSMATGDDSLPPSAYQGSPYPDHFVSSDTTGNLQPSDGSNSKSYDEEGGGEFGGLVSYFSSQREDDLDT